MRFAFMNERDIQVIRHINKHYQELLEEVRSIDSLERFKQGGVLVKAVKMDILQITENINCLTQETSKMINPKDLRGIVDVRNHIAHGYIYVDDEIIWDVIKDCLPKLIEEINSLK